MSRSWRALVLDDEFRWQEALSETLRSCALNVDVAARPEEVKRLLAESFYHLLVLDISMNLGDRWNMEGLKLLGELHEEGQDQAAMVVIISAHRDEEKMDQVIQSYSVAAFLAKKDFDSRRFQELVMRALPERVPLNLQLEIRWHDGARPEDLAGSLRLAGTRVRKEETRFAGVAQEVDDLFCRLFSDAVKIVVRPMAHGRSGSSLARVEPFYSAGGGRSVVVKLGDVERMEKEAANFEHFVKPFLGGGRSTSLLGLRRTSRLAGIRYSLLGASSDSFESFGAFYHRSDIRAIEAAVDNLIIDTCGQWYQNAGPLEPIDLGQDYRELLGFSWQELEQTLASGLKAVQGKTTVVFDSLSDRRFFRNALVTTRDRILVHSTRRAVMHGDLGESNVLVDQAGLTWLIDFLRTGQGHILRDVAQLDAVVRFVLLTAEKASLDDRLALEEALLSRGGPAPSPFASGTGLHKAYAVACHLRRLAAERIRHVPISDLEEYLVASLYLALNMIRFFDLPRVQREHAFLSSCLIGERLGL